MRKKIVPASLNLYTITINNVSNCYWSCWGLIEKVIYVEVLFNYSSH